MSIFTQIITGEIPSHKIYEDDRTLAFMDIHPVAEGHVLVVPKVEVEYIWDLAPDDYDALMRTVQKVGQRLREIVGKPYVGTMVIGTDVPHAHVHRLREIVGKPYVGTMVIGTDVPHAHVHVEPFTETAELKRTLDNATLPTDHEALRSLAERLKF